MREIAGAAPREIKDMLSNVSIWQLLIVLVIVIAIFGTKKLKTIGSDVGSAVKGFRSAMNDADKETSEQLGDQSKDASFDIHPSKNPPRKTTVSRPMKRDHRAALDW